jgi:serine beta-lactamase-like protein LACTB, mitochondrial
MFKDDPLESKPGSKFLYTTHGFTLISAVLEKAADQDFPGLLKDLFRKIGMNHTYLDFNQPIMPHRTKYNLLLISYTNFIGIIIEIQSIASITAQK